jgi:hypothetical protein
MKQLCKTRQTILLSSQHTKQRYVSGVQVPASLAVCFIDSRGQVAKFRTGQQWNSSFSLGTDSLSIKWELFRDSMTGGRVYYNNTCT